MAQNTDGSTGPDRFSRGLVSRAQPRYREAVDLPLRRLLRKVFRDAQHVAGAVRGRASRLRIDASFEGQGNV